MKRLALLLPLFLVAVALAQEDHDVELRWARPELSGIARVKGGFLVVEDELVGSCLFLESESLDEKALTPRLVKLERRRGSSQPTTPLTRLLPLEDFEDVASDGKNTVYFLGSHAGKDGKRRLEREFIVKAEWKDRELRVPTPHDSDEDGVFTGLIDALAAAGVDATKVNAEGLALADKTLYVGLRSPLSEGKKALLFRVPVSDLFKTKRSSPKLERLELDLGGGGVRGLHWDSDRLLVLSGPTAEETAESALYAFDTRLEKLRAFPTTRGAPEGIARSGEHLTLVFDGERGTGAEILRFPFAKKK